ncbi:hypothetical protein NTE_03173 [Candidatus Nitrososphaera evergladensis SR1]|uniref:Uncharacterized protein n=1 Tax=Candidatus Nitrososphaera evergladensis SR1 TaxID=1459636 RepID=A0A075MVC1_9ARCH|nr:hypothetical protein [Candidatus Nitrososphaera evergladensis]AIF85205.1 hypothetical protein NTE_03173 [Candidatus Nitrososphaera evergladensis SR1]
MQPATLGHHNPVGSGLIAVIPPIAGQPRRDPLEIAFVYPSSPPQPRPVIGEAYYFVIDILLLLLSIISGIGLLKRQRWAWFSAIGLFALVIFVHVAASIAVGPDEAGQGFIGTFDSSYGRLASIAISLTGFYLLSRRGVRNYLNNKTITWRRH